MIATPNERRTFAADGFEPLDDDAAALLVDSNVEPSAVATDRFAPEWIAERMLTALRAAPTIPIFDFADPELPGVDEPDDAMLAARKEAADFLVRCRLARFNDGLRSDLTILNAGRYWALNGGFMGYLREEPNARGLIRREPDQNLEEVRAGYARLMQMRLNTFWWSFGLSIAGFFITLISVTVALIWGGRLWR